MGIVLHQDFLSTTKNKHILLDTCVFIDAFSRAREFGKLFNEFKDNNSSIVTTSLVLNEFLKGSPTKEKFDEKKKFVFDIVETILPSVDMQSDIEILIKKYGIESKDLSETDLNLGGTIMKYGSNIYLLTRDLSDFPTNIYKRNSFMNLTHRKGIFAFGLYSYSG